MVWSKERLIVDKERENEKRMDDSEERRKCWKQEEEEKKKNFQPISFFHILSPQFHHQLALPEKFVNDVQEELADIVTIKGPSGAMWEVGVTADNNALFFKHGWQKFVEDHSLEENDILMFYYCGNSRFEVAMFDGQNGCMKEASFVGKCEDQGLENLTQKRNATEEKSTLSVEHVNVDAQTPESVATISPAKSVAARAIKSDIMISMHPSEEQ